MPSACSGSSHKRLCKKPSLGCVTCGTSNPPKAPLSGDLSLNSPLIRGARGVKNDERWVSCTVSFAGTTNIEFLHSLTSRNPVLPSFLRKQESSQINVFSKPNHCQLSIYRPLSILNSQFSIFNFQFTPSISNS